jgi:hypothetical protein
MVGSKLRHLFGKYESFSLGDPKVCFRQPSGDIFLRYGPELFYSICPICLKHPNAITAVAKTLGVDVA